MIGIRSRRAQRILGAITALVLLCVAPTLWALVWQYAHPDGTEIDGTQVHPPWRWIKAPRWFDPRPDALIKLPYVTSFICGVVWALPGSGEKVHSFDKSYAIKHGRTLIVLPPAGATICTAVASQSGFTARSILTLDCSLDEGRNRLTMIGQADDLAFFLSLARKVSNQNAAGGTR